MNSVFEKIKEKLEEKCFDAELYNNDFDGQTVENLICFGDAVEILDQVAEEYNNGWISVEERLPEVETEVLICARRKYRDGSYRDIITTAMYEDGTVRENDSCWSWEDIDDEWDEDEDCLIIPESWWENKYYNADGELNHAVDDEVIAWQPLPEPYKEGE